MCCIDFSNDQYLSSFSDFTCAFEEDDICGFEQMTDDNFDWAKHRGESATRKTGPSGDHTTGTGKRDLVHWLIKTLPNKNLGLS